MSTRGIRPGQLWLNWLGVVLMMVGALTWLPAAAQDGSPEAGPPPVVETALPTEPEPEAVEPTLAPPTSAPAEPPTVDEPAEEPVIDEPAAQERLTLQAAPRVTSLTLTCTVAGATIDGAAVVTDADGSTISLRLVTTDVPAIGPLQEVGVTLTPGQNAFAFEAELEPNDVATSTTKRVVVVGPDGSPVSNPIPVQQDANGATSCVPEQSTSPTATTPPSPTAMATTTATATATGTVAPTTSVGRVSNTGAANLNCRAQANTSATIIARIPAGTTVQVRGAASGGWVPVRCNDQDGWVSADFLVVTTAPASATPTATATGTPTTTPVPGTTTYGTVSGTGGSNLRCRTTPATAAAIVTLLPAGSRVETRGAAVNGWLPVRCGGQDGWVSASFVTLSTGPATPTATAPTTPAATTTPAPGGGSSFATVSGTGGSGLRCRTTAVSGAVITVLPELARVETIGSQQNGWIQARCGGRIGWVSVTYLMFNVGTGSGEIWMDIDLGDQYMVVYQGDKAIARTYVSTGRPGFDTPTGTYYINRKVPVKDMTGTLGGEYYYVHDVPSVMYFTNRGHAIHGAYWHNNFGYRMSHGCVNLPVGFAKWLYSVTPMGARVRIHY